MNSEYTSHIDTKLYPPISRAPLIDRRHLLEMLDKNSAKKLILVAAPAGFGKTTLIGQWYQTLQRKRQLRCWYSLDYKDNNAVRFLKHCIGALQRCGAVSGQVASHLESSLVPDISDALPAIINDLSNLDQDIVFFIDDFHLITNEDVIHFLELLINLSPQNLHIVISTRVRPFLTLSGLLMRNELFEITAQLLRFDARETKALMHEAIGLDLSEAHLASLYEHSEGWVAGLQLASLSLHDPARRDKFIDSFSGSLSDISEYLASDVLSQQDQEVKEFLLRTSILDRLCAPACDALTGWSNGRELLERIEASNLFLTPVDETGEWFRYHQLFQEFLRTQLRRVYPEEIVALHRRASDWCVDSGYVNEAVNYALITGDLAVVGEIVNRKSSTSTLSMDGRMFELISWLDGIPENVKLKLPRLLVQQCLALCELFRPAEAVNVHKQATMALQKVDAASDPLYSEDELQAIRANAQTLPLFISYARDDVQGMMSKLATATSTQDDVFLGSVHNAAGYAHLANDDFSSAMSQFDQARFHHSSELAHYGAVYSDCFTSIIELRKFDLHEANRYAQEAESSARKLPGTYYGPALAKARVMQAVVLYEWGQIDQALELLDQELKYIEKAGNICITQYGFITLSKCQAAKHNYTAASMSLNKCLQLSQHTESDYIHSVVELEKLKLNYRQNPTDIGGLAQSDVSLASLIEALSASWSRENFARVVLLLHRQIYSDRCDNFPQMADVVIRFCAERNLQQWRLRLLLLVSVYHLRQGADKQAFNLLLEVIESAAIQQGKRLLLDAGDEVLQALPRLQTDDAIKSSAEKAEFLQDVIRLDEHKQSASASTASKTDSNLITIVEALSGREIEVLQLLAEGKSNIEIGSDLAISENTVKWHVRNILSKLNVVNRTAAVIVAQQQNIISEVN